MDGNPPTCQEFAQMWESEYQRRKENPAAPKEEWAYINFVQQALVDSPLASREVIQHAWECERQSHKANVHTLLS